MIAVSQPKLRNHKRRTHAGPGLGEGAVGAEQSLWVVQAAEALVTLLLWAGQAVAPREVLLPALEAAVTREHAEVPEVPAVSA